MCCLPFLVHSVRNRILNLVQSVLTYINYTIISRLLHYLITDMANEPVPLDSSSDSGSSCSSGDENKERGNWTGRLDFLLACIGYAVGLGNVWRFPYLCYRNGGGESYKHIAPLYDFSPLPMMKGLGYGMVIVSGIVCIYYNVIITWTLYYMYLSVRESVVPWATCGNPWNTADCRELGNASGDAGYESLSGDNSSSSIVNVSEARSAYVNIPSQEFWTRYVLQISSGIEDMGSVRLELLACLFIAWVLIFVCVSRGIKSSGRVVYFTATFPYVLLTVLLIRGCMLEGAVDGLRFYLQPKWGQLRSFKVWGDAATQIFYSLGPAWGGLITFASFNKFHNNCYRDALLVPLINCGTSVYAGLVVFAILGYLSAMTGLPIEDVVKQGPGLAFVVYPAAIATLPLSPLWACLFFFMLLLVGMDTQFGMFETMTSSLIDEFPQLLRNRKMLFTGFMCFIEFLFGIPCIMNGGMYVLQLMDWYCAAFALMFISLIECIVIGWVYGADRFLTDISVMIDHRPGWWWKLTWCYISPIVVFCLLVFTLVMHTPISYNNYSYPQWAIVIGWMMALSSLVPIPISAVCAVYTAPGNSLWERVRMALRPTPEWGPAIDRYRIEYKQVLHEHGFMKSVPESSAATLVNLREMEPLEI
ncbi:PREDICTED: sodium- and chloride-dependent glycine transporter 1-like [Priapulus caudatus]|uniref:Sodium- and chloride-dependent glycine transporter 1-like n=1 Tax=Priapulus caudatus TaxID=37621 RepID=A0ABM1E875_PRICU|nr:PREDICTED: sodium- and chloride-dependent glycine transporter 1-like [Priapulus caudatus]